MTMMIHQVLVSPSRVLVGATTESRFNKAIEQKGSGREALTLASVTLYLDTGRVTAFSGNQPLGCLNTLAEIAGYIHQRGLDQGAADATYCGMTLFPKEAGRG